MNLEKTAGEIFKLWLVVFLKIELCEMAEKIKGGKDA